jgi:hypothetical protein
LHADICQRNLTRVFQPVLSREPISYAHHRSQMISLVCATRDSESTREFPFKKKQDFYLNGLLV